MKEKDLGDHDALQHWHLSAAEGEASCQSLMTTTLNTQTHTHTPLMFVLLSLSELSQT